MNEITNALRVANAAFRTVRFMEIAKKVIVVSAVAICCFFAVKFWRSR